MKTTLKLLSMALALALVIGIASMTMYASAVPAPVNTDNPAPPPPAPEPNPPAPEPNAPVYNAQSGAKGTADRDVPAIYGVKYADGTVSFKVTVQSRNAKLYEGADVQVTFNGETQDITLDETGTGIGSFPAQPGEAYFAAKLMASPSTQTTMRRYITGAGKVTY